MSKPLRVFLIPALALLLASCVFEEPVFNSGLKRPSTALEGLWKTVDANGNVQHAALFPLNAQTSLLQYPIATNGWWFEAQSLQINGRDLLQLRILAGPDAKPPESGAKNHTLAWLETQPDGTVRMRALDGRVIEKGKFIPSSLREFLAKPDSDWNTVFGTPSTFRRSAAKKYKRHLAAYPLRKSGKMQLLHYFFTQGSRPAGQGRNNVDPSAAISFTFDACAIAAMASSNRGSW